jgi:hypothetical protein
MDSLAECDKRAVQLLRDYQAHEIKAHISREKNGGFLVWSSGTAVPELAADLERLAETLFDGSTVSIRQIKP